MTRLATLSRSAVLLAVVTPLLLLHVDYQPRSRSGRAPPTATLMLSDVLLLVVAAAVGVRLARDGSVPCAGALPILASRRQRFWPGSARASCTRSSPNGDYDVAQHLSPRPSSSSTRCSRPPGRAPHAGRATSSSCSSDASSAGARLGRRGRPPRSSSASTCSEPGPPVGGSRPGSAITTLRRRRGAPSRSGSPRSFSAAPASAAARRRSSSDTAGLVLSGSVAGLARRRGSCLWRRRSSRGAETWPAPACAPPARPSRVSLALSGVVALRGSDLADFLRFIGVLRGAPGEDDRGRRDVLAPDAARLSSDSGSSPTTRSPAPAGRRSRSSRPR